MPNASLVRALPSPEVMKLRLRTFAMLDAIVAPETRSFEFHPKWRRGEQLGAFKDGSGNFFFAWFSSRGAVIRGFDHESPMSPFRKSSPALWPGLLDGFPKALSYANREPAFAQDELTFCLWNTDDEWKSGAAKPPKGRDVDGAERLLACFRPRFKAWAEKYYDQKLDGSALDRLWWQREPVDDATAAALNPDFDAKAVKDEVAALGWAEQRDFGEAEFTVRCEPTFVALIANGKVVKKLNEDVYEELYDFVHARLSKKKK